jgi:tRNA-dihydrouridine synthase
MAGFWNTLERPFTALAPMEDVTDTVFRQLVAKWGAPDVFFTEFVNVDGMCSAGREAVIHRLRYTEAERPLVAQVWGLRPENFEIAARDIAAMGFDGIDINMGCPVKKIIKSGACSALIDNPSLAAEMIQATKDGAGDLPVSVKTRIGFRKKCTLEWSGFLLDHDIAALTIHGRIAKDMSDVPADWDEVGKVAALRNEMGVRTLVIGNGDVESMAQVVDFHGRHGVDGAMVGRGIFHNPFLFAKDASSFDELPFEAKASLLREHVALYRRTWGDKKNFNVMKKFVKVYIRGFEGASHIRGELMEAASYTDMLRLLGS